MTGPGTVPPAGGGKPKARRYKAAGILGVLLSGLLIAFLVARIDRHRALAALAEARPGYLGLAGALALTLPFLAAFRWMNILNSQNGIRVGYRPALRATFLSSSLDSLVPAKAGDLAKVVLFRSQGGGLVSGLGAMLLERSLDFLVLGALSLFGAAWSGSRWGLWAGTILAGGTIGFLLAIALVPWSRIPAPARVRALLRSIQAAHRASWRNRRSVFKAALGSLLNWSAGALVLWSLVQAFGGGADLGYLAAIYPLASIAGLAPITLGGMGTRDAAFIYFLSAAMTGEKATLVAFGYSILAYWMLSLICSSLFLLGAGRPAIGGEPKTFADSLNSPALTIR